MQQCAYIHEVPIKDFSSEINIKKPVNHPTAQVVRLRRGAMRRGAMLRDTSNAVDSLLQLVITTIMQYLHYAEVWGDLLKYTLELVGVLCGTGVIQRRCIPSCTDVFSNADGYCFLWVAVRMRLKLRVTLSQHWIQPQHRLFVLKAQLWQWT